MTFDDVWVFPSVPRWGRQPGLRLEVQANPGEPWPTEIEHMKIAATVREARMPVGRWTRFPYPVLDGDVFTFGVRIPGDFAAADIGSGRLVLPAGLDPTKRIEIRIHRMFVGFGYTRGSESVVAVDREVFA